MLESIAGYIQSNSGEILARFIDFFRKPFINKEMVWMIIPAVVTIIVMEIYYSKHKKELTGWNTATANSLVLIFIAMDLFRFLSNKGSLSFSNPGSYAFSASVLVSIVLLEAIFMFVMDFSHIWPRFLAFHFSSHLTVNLIAYTSIVILYGGIPLTPPTFIAAIIFFLLMNLLFFLVRILYPSKG
ncbi:MAG: hypothetical protein ISS25_00905 [Nanoarchaeota archaeon]|nr:hypothetical protein [DPANN group archaeon]MBL7116375.1 hypothetical protein [Nanoarchaeota archaeon]